MLSFQHSGKRSRRFRWIFKKNPRIFSKIPGNVGEDFGESSKRFRRIFITIPGNVWKIPRNVTKNSGELNRVNKKHSQSGYCFCRKCKSPQTGWNSHRTPHRVQLSFVEDFWWLFKMTSDVIRIRKLTVFMEGVSFCFKRHPTRIVWLEDWLTSDWLATA